MISRHPRTLIELMRRREGQREQADQLGGAADVTAGVRDGSTTNIPTDDDSVIVLPNTAGAPADAPAAGTTRYDRATGILWAYDGAAWKSVQLT